MDSVALRTLPPITHADPSSGPAGQDAAERSRLEALRAYVVLDTPPEPEFDQVTELAARICGTPIALISLVDEARQWFKSRVGVDASETPRDITFCDHGIRGNTLFVVPDAANDARFRDSPMVVDEPHVRFYAGAPLTTPAGQNVGMLCVNDRIPRALTPEQMSSLSILANVVVRQLELRKSLREVADLAQSLDRAKADSDRTSATLAAVLEATQEGLLAASEDGMITAHNQRLLSILGIDAKEAYQAPMGHVWDAFLSLASDPASLDGCRQRAAALGAADSFDVVELKDGRVLELSSRAQLAEGSLAGRVWSLRDVTARRLAERDAAENAERARELRRLQDVDEFKTRLINTASHEFNTPITAIRMQLYLLETATKQAGSTAVPRAMEVLKRNVERLSNLVRDTIETARVRSGRLELDPKPFDAQALLLEVAATLEPMARHQGVRLVTPPSPPVPAHGDEYRMVQVLHNLASNAIKFTPKGGTVDLRAAATRGGVVFTVRDTGIGMTKAQMQKLFQPFVRVHDDTQHVVRGTGLGLYLCHGIVARHGGRIRCHSPGPGQGTQFLVELPSGGRALRRRPIGRGRGPSTPGAVPASYPLPAPPHTALPPPYGSQDGGPGRGAPAPQAGLNDRAQG